jgi:hypothetical protein
MDFQFHNLLVSGDALLMTTAKPFRIFWLTVNIFSAAITHCESSQILRVLDRSSVHFSAWLRRNIVDQEQGFLLLPFRRSCGLTSCATPENCASGLRTRPQLLSQQPLEGRVKAGRVLTASLSDCRG